LFYGNNIEYCNIFDHYKQKRTHAAKHKGPIHKTITMQKYNIADFIGEFERNSTSPNTFYSASMDMSIVLRCRANPQVGKMPNYLVYRKGKGKAHYMSALWSFNSTTKGAFEYIITDTQGAKAIVEIDMFILRIKKP
jgi:hypothetical protein